MYARYKAIDLCVSANVGVQHVRRLRQAVALHEEDVGRIDCAEPQAGHHAQEGGCRPQPSELAPLDQNTPGHRLANGESSQELISQSQSVSHFPS